MKKTNKLKHAKRVKVEGGILASGEATGHHHRVTVDVYETDVGVREFDGATKVSHEEHNAIDIPHGKWLSAQVVEFDHINKILREVRD
jgi:hypothetical protein